MGHIEDLKTFVQIVEQGSIGKAAEQEGVAKSAISRKLRLLEERLQIKLITRTTRQWALTEAGREYYERGLGVINAFNEFEASVRHDDANMRGEIKLSVPLYFGQVSLRSHLLEFARRHPEVHLNIDFNDSMVDIVNGQFDLVVRISDMPDSTLIARKLYETRHVCCASPDYIANHPRIVEPEDLQGHRTILYGSSKRAKWNFTSPGGKIIVANVKASMNSLDGAFLIEAAEQSLGIIRVPDFLAQASLESGRLVALLETYELKPRGIFIVYPSARYLPHRTRELMEYLLKNIKKTGVR